MVHMCGAHVPTCLCVFVQKGPTAALLQALYSIAESRQVGSLSATRSLLAITLSTVPQYCFKPSIHRIAIVWLYLVVLFDITM